MSRVTFVAEFPEGQEPLVNAGLSILGGRVVSVAFYDWNERLAWRPAHVEPPYDIPLFVLKNDRSVAVSSCSESMGWREDDADEYVIGWLPVNVLPEDLE